MKQLLFILSMVLSMANIGLCQNRPPVAVNDTVWGYAPDPVYVDLLKNDYDPDGDSIFVLISPWGKKINDSTWKYDIADSYQYTYDSVYWKIFYKISDEHDSISKANLVIRFKAHNRYDYLDANNIKALISSFGNHFWDGDSARFEVPKGSGKNAMFNNAMWIGGLDENEQLHLAAEHYRGEGPDLYTGPISDSYDTTYLKKWYKIWKLNKTQIQHHINNWYKQGYVPIDAISTWPAHGDTIQGQSFMLAPFYDYDYDGIFNPLAGDYPLIRGDQTVLFIMNDSRIHQESDGFPLGIEIIGMAYAFDKPDDSTLNNTIFFHYDIRNRSNKEYHDTYIGLYADFNFLKTCWDDFIGCDVTNGLYYTYDGDSVDGNGEPQSYGEHPPAIGLKVIGGPYLEPDGYDNPTGGCDFSLNGLNFGDGIADNERYGLEGFLCQWPRSSPWYWEPIVAIEYYRLLQTQSIAAYYLRYGDPINCPDGSLCKYMYPGNSDTICNWGTFGKAPLCGYNLNGKYWTEIEQNNKPGNRYGLANTGPFTFKPNTIAPLDYCFTFARDYVGDNIASVQLLRDRITGLKPQLSSLIQLPDNYNEMEESVAVAPLLIYPNPAHTRISVVLEYNKSQQYWLYSTYGMLVQQGILKPGTTILEINNLASGIYFIRSEGRVSKFIKY